MTRHDGEFYVGYAKKSPPGIAVRSRGTVVLVLLLGLAIGLVLLSSQARFDVGTFEFGVDKKFDGIAIERPYPMLLVADTAGSGDDLMSYYLVAFGKHGADELLAGMDSKPVRVTGSLIYNDSQRMIEAHAIEPLQGDAAEDLRALHRVGDRHLGSLTLVGEIVDSKCHFGVMKPGRGKVHKACAIRCISGGVPPLLRVEDRSGDVSYFLLVGPEGLPVNREVLDMVAEPVEITGDVVRTGDRLVLYSDPATYRRLD
jgi:hypothetical protein